MDYVDSEPIEILRWALDNLSPAEVVRSSVRESFREFLRRGTVPQLQQLLEEVRELPCDATGSQEDKKSKRDQRIKRCQRLLHRSPSRKSASRSAKRAGSTEAGASPVNTPSTTSASPQSSHPDTVFSPNTQGWCGNTGSSEGTIPSSYSGSPHHDQLFDQSTPCTPLHVSPSLEPNMLLGGLYEASSHEILCRATKFFNERMGARRARISYLIRSIQGFVEAPSLAADFAEDLWSSRSAIFVKPKTSDCSTRLRSLYEGHRKIKRAREQHSYAARFCYIYLEHDLEALLQSQFLVLSQGRGKMTAAFELQAEIISTTVDVVKSERKAGRGYLQLLMEGGPGFILRLGRNVSTLWERKLSSSDISLIIEFLRTETPDLLNEIKSYDESATKALLDGFLAYGWTPEEILSSKSSLFHKLREYVNLEGILRDSTSSLASLSTRATSATANVAVPQYCEGRDISQQISNADERLTTLLNASLDNHIGPAECSLSGSGPMGDLWAMSAAELESILAQTDELVGPQHSVNSSVWDEYFPEGVRGF